MRKGNTSLNLSSSIPPIYRKIYHNAKEKQALKSLFLLRNCFYWASCNASTTIDANIWIAYCCIFQSQSFNWASGYTSTTSDAKVFVNSNWHVLFLHL